MWQRLSLKYKLLLALMVICLSLLALSIWQIQEVSKRSLTGSINLMLDGGGNLYANGESCVSKFNSDYSLASNWCRPPVTNSYPPERLVADPQGNFYYTLSIHYTLDPHVQKLDRNGNIVLAWGLEGYEDGQFVSPSNLITDREGMIYVVDSDGTRIQKFDGNGRFLAKWTLKKPVGITSLVVITHDHEGQMYISNNLNVIQKFDSSGNFLANVNVAAKTNASVSGLGVDGAGNFYIATEGRILKTDRNGQILTSWVIPPPDSIAVDEQGKVYVLQVQRPAYAYIFIYDSNGKLLSMIDGSSEIILLWIMIALVLFGGSIFLLLIIIFLGIYRPSFKSSRK